MERIFTVDIGNTAAKGAVFESGNALEIRVVDSSNPDQLTEMARRHGATGAACCDVHGSDPGFATRLRARLDIPVVELKASTPVPVAVDYGSRESLGVDRVAAAVGAHETYGGDLMVVDAGTAVTLDIVTAGIFRGGNISPGLRLRFRSLHEFTGRLPFVNIEGDLPLFGRDTQTAIRSGVVRGLLREIAGEFEEAKKRFPNIRLLITGGDADFLYPLLKEAGTDCRLDHNLVGRGLEQIYKYNVNEQD